MRFVKAEYYNEEMRKNARGYKYDVSLTESENLEKALDLRTEIIQGDASGTIYHILFKF